MVSRQGTMQQGGLLPINSTVGDESSTSAVSWAAIFAGAVVAAAASLLLVTLGAGLGFASVSPWSNDGLSATTFTVATAIWLIVVQWLASALGGYMTGRLRTKWVGAHTHEVFFRDTAHGLITWAAATIITSAIIAAAASAVVSGGAKVAGSIVSGAAQTTTKTGAAAAVTASSAGYEIDSLFRSGSSNARVAADPNVRTEVWRILAKGMGQGEVTASDRKYLTDLIASRTGIAPEEATQRLDNVISQLKEAELKAKQLADAARKAAATTGLFTALSMLIGAFIASVAAALGGAQRDQHP